MLRVAEVAARLKLSESKVYQLLSSGVLPHHRFGNRYRVSEEQLADYLEGTKRGREAAVLPRAKPPRPRLRHISL